MARKLSDISSSHFCRSGSTPSIKQVADTVLYREGRAVNTDASMQPDAMQAQRELGDHWLKC